MSRPLTLLAGLAVLAVAADAAAQPNITRLPEVTREVDPVFPSAALDVGVQASVTLDVDILEDGFVDTVTVVKVQLRDMDGNPIEGDDSYGFGQAATVAGAQLEFSPAEANGVPTAVRIQYTFHLLHPSPRPRAPRLDNLVTQPPPGTTAPLPIPVVNMRGVLVERGTRRPVPGATITVYRGQGDAAEGYEATSDDNGEFVFYDLAPDSWNVIAELEGYLKFETSEKVEADKITEVKYFIEKGSYNPYDVTVEVEPPRKEVNRRTLTTADITKVPGTLGDPVLVIENLPGVARAQPGLIVVRGSGPQDTFVYIDGAFVPLIYHFGGLKSVLPAELIESVDFYPGNYSVEYGRGMGGVFDLHLKKLDADRIHGSADVSVLDTSLFVQTPVGDDAAIAIAGRRSYVDFVLDAVIPEDSDVGLISAPRYWDFQLLGNWRPTPAHDLRAMFIASDDLFELLFEEPSDTIGTAAESGDLAAKTSFQRLTTEYRYTPDQTLQNRLKFAVGRDRFFFSALDIFKLDIEQTLFQARNSTSYQVNDEVRLTGGLDGLAVLYQGNVLAPPLPAEGEPQNNQVDPDEIIFTEFDDSAFAIAPFVEAEVTLGKLTLVPGLRFDYFSLSDAYSFDPRIVGRYQLASDWVAKAGAAVTHQEGQFPELDVDFGNPDLGLQTAYQYSVGGEWSPLEFIKLDVTLFYKDMRNLVSPTDSFVERDGEMVPQRYDNGGTGRVYGGELFAEHTFANNIRGWISYTLSRAERTDSGEDERRLFDFDQTHILAVVASYLLPRNWEIGLRYRLVSGDPRTPIIGSVFVSERDEYAPIYGAINSTRLPMFQQLDLRVDKTWVFDTWKLAAYISLINATNHTNVEDRTYNFDYSEEGSVNGLPILPILGIKGEW